MTSVGTSFVSLSSNYDLDHQMYLLNKFIKNNLIILIPTSVLFLKNDYFDDLFSITAWTWMKKRRNRTTIHHHQSVVVVKWHAKASASINWIKNLVTI